MKKIYVAIPYSKVDKNESFRLANKISAMLVNSGHAVFSPITQGHALVAENDLPTDWEFWEKFDIEFIKWADEVHVVMMMGWRFSTGVNAEIKIAEKLNKPVRYFSPDGEEVTWN